MTGKQKGQAGTQPGPGRANSFEHALVLETARVTEGAALAASRWVGMGDKNAVDGAGTEAMRELLNSLDIRGRVVIGEGERA